MKDEDRQAFDKAWAKKTQMAGVSSVSSNSPLAMLRKGITTELHLFSGMVESLKMEASERETLNKGLDHLKRQILGMVGLAAREKV